MKAPLVTLSVEAGIVRLVLNRPEAGNAVTPGLIDDFMKALNELEGAEIAAIVLGGDGANFCVGADLRRLAGRIEHIEVELRRMADSFHACVARLVELPAPLVVRAQGAAVGAGFGLLLAADYVVCAETARFSTGYSKLGLSPDAGVSWFLTRALGPRLASSLLMTSRFVSAHEAVSLGLVDERCAPEDLHDRAHAAAERLAQIPPQAYAAISRLVAEAAVGCDFRTHLDRERDEIVALACDKRVTQKILQFTSTSVNAPKNPQRNLI
jgi:2-(1,2-epoxy-1,2-dihydrophenyl)acetyl-CoA isomerase